jgi:hypothetical protein
MIVLDTGCRFLDSLTVTLQSKIVNRKSKIVKGNELIISRGVGPSPLRFARVLQGLMNVL